MALWLHERKQMLMEQSDITVGQPVLLFLGLFVCEQMPVVRRLYIYVCMSVSRE